MLCAYIGKLKQFDIVLASSSPRRRSILSENIGLSFRIEVPTFKENLDKSTFATPDLYVSQTCRMKCQEIISKHEKLEFTKPTIIISADTIVTHNNEILEKPSDAQGAFAMLRKLSGKEQTVMTAVTIALKSSAISPYKSVTFCEQTVVQFDELSDEIIAAYVATGEPLDKAGSYGIQALGSSFVTSLQGCYFNVVGFPVSRFCKELINMLKVEGL